MFNRRGGEAPRFVSRPKSASVAAGRDVTLSCWVAGEPSPDVAWEKDRRPVRPDARRKLSAEERGAHSLTVYEARGDDAGEYTCRARNSAGEAVASATLDVDESAPFRLSGSLRLRDRGGYGGGGVAAREPSFVVRPSAQKVSRGADATFSCRILGRPPPAVAWQRDGVDVDTLPDGHRFAAEFRDGVHSLTVSAARTTDAGTYSCHARNRAGEAVASTVLSVSLAAPTSDSLHLHRWSEEAKSLPRSHLHTTRDHERKKLELLRQSADARLARLSPYTRRGDARLLGAPHVTLSRSTSPTAAPDGYLSPSRSAPSSRTHSPVAGHVDEYHSRSSYSYRLTRDYTSNSSSTSSLYTGYSPSRSPVRMEENHDDKNLTKTFKVREGKHARLSCYVTGKPKPEIVWKKDDEVISPGRRHMIYEDDEGYYILKVLFCKQSDRGLYTCTATNVVGKTYSPVQLIVNEPLVPFKERLRDVEVMERQSATLQCEVPAESAHASWFMEETPLAPKADKYVMEEEGTMRRLTICNVTADDEAVYVCEMPEGSRTVAELSVKGAIVQKLPRRTEVREKEVAHFLVELDQEGVGGRWLRNGEEIDAGARAVVKVDGKSHSLTLAGVTQADAGEVSFVCGDSKTSSQLIVTAPRLAPPGAPTDPKVTSQSENWVMLAWKPGPKKGKAVAAEADEAFVVEYCLLGNTAWGRCHDSASVPGTELRVGNLPEEGDYLFRISAINKAGRSLCVEVPGTYYIVPESRLSLASVPRDVEVLAGEDAVFVVELSGGAAGSWSIDGEAVRASERHAVQHTRNTHTLMIRAARPGESGASVQFVSGPVRAQMKLIVKEPPATFRRRPDAQTEWHVAPGERVVLSCEVSRADAAVTWLRDGQELAAPASGVRLESVGLARRLVIQQARMNDSASYGCRTDGDSVGFSVSVKEPPLLFSAPLTDVRGMAGEPLVLRCRLSREAGDVEWKKDGVKVRPGKRHRFASDGAARTLTIAGAGPEDGGEYSCETPDGATRATVTVQEPPATFRRRPDAQTEWHVAPGERVVLSCEVSRADAAVTWLRDGQELAAPASGVRLESVGLARRLVIQQAQTNDSASYGCCTDGDSVGFSVSVKEPPLLFSAPLTDVRGVAGEPLVLRCRLSQEAGDVEWKKDGVKVRPGKRHRFASDGAARTLTIAGAGPEDGGEYSCETPDGATRATVTVQEPPATFRRRPDAQTEWHVAPGERVVLSCEVSRADAAVTWLRDGQELAASASGVRLESVGLARRLVIQQAQTNDSASYGCRTDGDSVGFSVSVKEPPLLFSAPLTDVRGVAGEPLVLRCRLSREAGDVEWKKDGVKVRPGKRHRFASDGAARTLTIAGAGPEDGGEYSCETPDGATRATVTVQEPPATFRRRPDAQTEWHVAPGERVVLSCEVSRADAAVTWLRDGQELATSASGVRLESVGLARRLVIQQARTNDSASYGCRTDGDSVGFSVSVKEPPLLFSAPLTDVRGVAGEPLVLRCRLSREAGDVEWKKDGVKVRPGKRHRFASDGAARTLTIAGAGPEDGGEYSCETPDGATRATVTVQEPPATFRRRPDAQTEWHVAPGERVVLSCEVSRADAAVTWLRDGQELAASASGVRLESVGLARRLVIQQARTNDSASYGCRTDGDSVGFSVSVKEPPLLFSAPLTDVRGVAGEPLVLRCRLSREAGDVEWKKDGVKVRPGKRHRFASDGAARTLTIAGAGPEDGGEYSCETPDGATRATVTVQEIATKLSKTEMSSRPPEDIKVTTDAPRAVAFITDLKSLTALEGEEATFKCCVSPPDVPVEWRRGTTPLLPGSRVVISSEPPWHSVAFRPLQLLDSGEISALADGRVRSSARLHVQEATVRFVRGLEPLAVEEGADAALEVEVSSAEAEVCWMRNGVVLNADERVRLDAQGPRRSLLIAGVRGADGGLYSCETLHDKSQARLRVEPRDVRVVRGLEPATATATEAATFQLELSHADVAARWWRDRTELKPSARCRPAVAGKTHTLTLSALRLDDSGIVAFEAEGIRSSARLTVTEPAVTFTRQLLDVRCPEKSSASLECEVSKANAEVKWFKDDAELKPGKRHRILAQGRKRSLVVPRAEIGDSGSYACRAGDHVTAATLAVHARDVQFVRPLASVEVREKEDAAFTCEVSHDEVDGCWLRDGKPLRADPRIKMRREARTYTLLLSNVTTDDAGDITFTAENAESAATLTIKELPVRFVKGLREKVAMEGHRVVLECQVSRANAAVRWSRGDEELILDDGDTGDEAGDEAPRVRAVADGCYRRLVVQDARFSDEGSYTCDATDDRTSASLLVEEPEIRVVRPLRDVEATEPEGATLECEVSAERVKAARWTLNGVELSAAFPGLAAVERDGCVHRVVIPVACPSMSGTVTFRAGKASTAAVLTVHEAPLEVSSGLADTEVTEREDVTISCAFHRANTTPLPSVAWFHGRVALNPSSKHHMVQEAGRACLTIRRVHQEDAGEYSCRAGGTSTAAVLTVRGRDVRVTRAMGDVDAEEKGTAVFRCELSRADADDAEWLLNDVQLVPGEATEISRDGRCHALKLSNLTMEDAGTVTFRAEGAEQTAQLHVKEEPLAFERELEDVFGEEQGTAELRCSLSRDAPPGVGVEWRGGRFSRPLTPSDKYEMVHAGRSLRLLVRLLRCEDAGSYSCRAGDASTTATLHVQELKLTITRELESQEVMEEESALFVCELSHEAIDGCRWLLNGSELLAGGRAEIGCRGRSNTLLLKNLIPEESGDVRFVARTISSTARLTIKEAPVKISEGLVDQEADEFGSATLTCQLSKPAVQIAWKKDSTLLQPSDKYEIKQEGKTAKLIIHDVEPGDAGKYDCDTGDDHTSAVLNVKEAPVLIREALRDQEALEFENLTLSCRLSKPNATLAWQMGSSILRPGEKYSLIQEGDVAKLTIYNLQMSDAGDYECDTGDDRTIATITVKEAPVLIRDGLKDQEVNECESAILTCQLSKTPKELVWEKDCTVLRPGDKYEMGQEGNVAMLIVHDVQMEDAGEYRCDTGDENTSASLTVKEAPVLISEPPRDEEAEEFGSAELSCRLSKPAREVAWRKGSVVLQPGEKYEMEYAGAVAKLIVHDLQVEDAGNYECDTGDDCASATLNVKEKPAVFTKGLEEVSVEERGDAVLLCELSKEGAPVSWLKDGRALGPDGRHEMSQEGRTARLVLHSLSLQDSGRYSCATGHDVTAATLTVTELDISIVRGLEDCEVQETQTATFTVEISHPDVLRVEWWLGESPVRNNELNELFVDGREHTLILNNLTLQDSGTIRFQAGNATSTATLTVTKLPVRVVRPLQDVAVEEEQAVSLECELSEAAADVVWRKDGRELEAGGRVAAGRDGNLVRLVVQAARPQDSGVYSCEAGAASSSATVHVRDLPVQVLEPLSDVTATEGGEASLRCSLSKPGTEVAWTKDSRPVRPGDKYDVGSEGLSVWLAVRALRLDDAGSYACHVGDLQTTAILTVQEKPAVFTKGLEEVSVEERGDAVLLCELSKEGAPVSWLKDGRALGPDGRHEMSQEGRTARLVLHSLSLQDSGRYSCATGHDVTAATLTVTEPDISIVRGLEDCEVQETERATFTAEISHPDVLRVEWWLGESPLRNNELNEISVSGREHTLTLRNVTLQDSGAVRFQAGAATSCATLRVNKLPVRVVRPLQDVAVEEEQAVSLECELSEAAADVVWRKDGRELEAGGRVAAGRDGNLVRLVVQAARPQDSGVYSCEAGAASSSATVHVRELPLQILEPLIDQEATEGESARLSCRLSKPHASVAWSRGSQPLHDGDKFEPRVDGRTAVLVIRDVGPDDAGTYTCRAGEQESAARLSVLEKPAVFTKGLEEVSVEERGDAVLLCELSKEGAPVSWLKDGRALGPDGRHEMSQEGRTARLVLHSLSLQDSGRYSCATGHDVTAATLTVTELPLRVVTPLVDVEVMSGEAATFSCELSRGAATDARWWLGDTRLLDNELNALGVRDERTHTLTLRRLAPDDSGRVAFCAGDVSSRATLTVTRRPVVVTSPLADTAVEEGEPLRLSCALSEPAPVTWSKDSGELGVSDRIRLALEGSSAVLEIERAALGDSGVYTCATLDNSSSARLTISEKVAVFIVPLEDVRAEERSRAVLSCELSRPDVDVVWLRDDVELEASPRASASRDGARAALAIAAVRTDDAGEYSCRTRHDRTAAVLVVTEFAVEITRPPADVEAWEGEVARFSCELSRADVEDAGWWLGEQPLGSNEINEVAASGATHALLLRNLAPHDSGLVTFRAARAQAAARLVVKRLPLRVATPLSAVVAEERSTASLVCELSRPAEPADRLAWTKDGVALEAGGRIAVEQDGARVRLTVRDVTLDDGGVYACHAGVDAVTSTVLGVTAWHTEMVRPLADQAVARGGEARFTVELSQAVPPSDVHWYLNGEEIATAVAGGAGEGTAEWETEQEGATCSLVLSRAHRRHGGDVECVVRDVACAARLAVHEEEGRGDHGRPGGPPESDGEARPRQPWDAASRRRRMSCEPTLGSIHEEAEEAEGAEVEVATLDRAATKIQAAFRGFKTRKELEREANPPLQPTQSSLRSFLIRQSAEEESFDGDEATAAAPEPQRGGPAQRPAPAEQTFREDGDHIYISFCDAAEAQSAADSFRRLFALQGQPVEVLLLEDAAESGRAAVVRVKKLHAAAPLAEEESGRSVPRFVQHLLGLTVEEGYPASFDCVVTGSPAPSVAWYKGDLQLREDDRHMINDGDDGSQQLVLTTTGAGDAGVYRCVAENEAGVASSRAELLVVDVLSPDCDTRKAAVPRAQAEDAVETPVPEEPPEFTHELHDLQVAAGAESTLLSVGVKGSPAPRVYWFKDGQPLPGSERLQLRSDGEQHTLAIALPTADDGGEYTVCASNPAGCVYTSAILVLQGEQKKLTPPRFVERFSNKRVPRGGSVTLAITLEGSPTPDVTWLKEDSAEDVTWIKETSEGFRLESAGACHSLTLEAVAPQHAGHYTVIATNPVGQAICTAYVDVRRPREAEGESEDLATTQEERLSSYLHSLPEDIAREHAEGEKRPFFEDISVQPPEPEHDYLLEADGTLSRDELPVPERDGRESRGSTVSLTEELIHRLTAQISDMVCTRFSKVSLRVPGGEGSDDDQRTPLTTPRRGRSRPTSGILESPIESDEGDAAMEGMDEFVATSDVAPSGEEPEWVPLRRGQHVEVLDCAHPLRWLVRTRPSVTEDFRQGWASSAFLEKRPPDFPMDAQRQREDESLKALSPEEDQRHFQALLGELVASEEAFVRDLEFVTSHHARHVETAPGLVDSQRDVIFRNLPDLMHFHSRVLLPRLRSCQDDTDVARAVLQSRHEFDRHVQFLYGKPRADVLLMSGPTQAAFERYEEALQEGPSPARPLRSVQEYLDLPLGQLGAYQSSLRELIRRRADRGGDCAQLQEAYALVAAVPRRAEDQMHLSMMEGAPSDLPDLGPLVRQDTFVVWEGRPSPRASWRGRVRHLFLFPTRLLICKPQRGSGTDSIVFLCRHNLPLSDVEVSSAAETDERTLELWDERESGLEKLTLRARSPAQKQAWLLELQHLQRGIERHVQETPEAWTPPEFVEPLSDCTARAGDIATLQCRVSGSPRPVITWHRDERPLEMEDRLSLNEDERRGCRLLVIRVCASDAGHYSCVANSPAGTARSTARLNVLVPPRFKTPLSSAALEEGEDVHFSCQVTGEPFPLARWFKDGEEVCGGDERLRTQSDEERGRLSLTVQRASKADAGKYTCLLVNAAGEARDSAELYVPVPVRAAGASQAVLVEVTEQETRLPKKTVIIEETITTIVKSPRLKRRPAPAARTPSPLVALAAPQPRTAPSGAQGGGPEGIRLGQCRPTEGALEAAEEASRPPAAAAATAAQAEALRPKRAAEMPQTVTESAEVASGQGPARQEASDAQKENWFEVEEVIEVRVKKTPRAKGSKKLSSSDRQKRRSKSTDQLHKVNSDNSSSLQDLALASSEPQERSPALVTTAAVGTPEPLLISEAAAAEEGGGGSTHLSEVHAWVSHGGGQRSSSGVSGTVGKTITLQFDTGRGLRGSAKNSGQPEPPPSE
ncbi:obscurin [Lampetra planeri]